MKILSYFLLLANVIGLNIACQKEAIGPNQNASNGVGGSTARFALVGNKLYTVSGNELSWFDIADAAHPQYLGKQSGFNTLETIFPQNGYLYLGSREGLVAYSLNPDGTPQFASDYTHFYACDPVVANDQNAFVTVRSGVTCRNSNLNELQVYSLAQMPQLDFMYSIPLSQPSGMGLLGNYLFVCDDGIKLFDITQIDKLRLIKKFDIQANDVIPLGNLILVTADDGFYQYRFANETLELLSSIKVTQ